MKKVIAGLTAVATVAFLATAAVADGMPKGKGGSVKDAPMRAASAGGCSAANWAGMYGGLNVGYAEHRAAINDLDYWWNGGSLHNADDGFSIGGGVGFNMQKCMAVWGVEADIAWTNTDRNYAYSYNAGGVPPHDIDIKHGMEWFGTICGRSGIAVENMLLYMTGGLAFANFQHSWTPSASNPPAIAGQELFSKDETKWGWVFGGGVEWALTERISFKSEVLYAKFEDGKASMRGPDFFGGTRDWRFSTQDEVYTARMGLNFKFGGDRGGAAAAPMK